MNMIHDDADGDVAIGLAIQSSIKCKFGRFGESIAVYLNETAVKCVSPSIPEDPEDIGRENVQFQVSMNGQDFGGDDENDVEFTFAGTGSSSGFGAIVLLIILCGPLIGAFVYYSNQQT